MFIVKLQKRYGFEFKEVDEVRLGSVLTCAGPTQAPEYPTINLDTCKSGGGHECVVLSHDENHLRSTDLCEHTIAQAAFIYTAQGVLIHEEFAPPRMLEAV